MSDHTTLSIQPETPRLWSTKYLDLALRLSGESPRPRCADHRRHFDRSSGHEWSSLRESRLMLRYCRVLQETSQASRAGSHPVITTFACTRPSSHSLGCVAHTNGAVPHRCRGLAQRKRLRLPPGRVRRHERLPEQPVVGEPARRAGEPQRVGDGAAKPGRLQL